ncbi:MAG: prepilin peptidase [Planctomycetaceae bacterium]|jgi:prepilin signal peptidase PulO-like enzyme (type II secretory pathway)|nr:prepilin peptidase [Planctomycetaceae bacterium]
MSLSSIFCIILAILIGSCVGSFLNVVIYRLPFGLSLSYPSSHCPKCKRLIRPYDNVPVFGWIMLGGRCRDCRELISLRYPVVEAISGLISGSISAVIFYSCSDILPFENIVISLYYFGIIVTLFAAGLIEFDRNKIPVKLFIPVTIISPIAFYYLDKIEFYTKLNGVNLFFVIVTIIISTAIMIVGFRFYFPNNDNSRKRKKSRLKNRGRFEFSLRILLPFLTAVIIGFGCGMISIPLLFFVTIISAFYFRYSKKKRLYLLLTGAVWVIIIYNLCLA